MIVLRKHLVKITVIFVSLFALASLLKFFYLTERFVTRYKWQIGVMDLLNDSEDFEYTYNKKLYIINDQIRGLITTYIKDSGTSGVNYSTFTQDVGTILNVDSKLSKKLSKKQAKTSAKQMIIKYAKTKEYKITGTHRSFKLRYKDGKMESYDSNK